MKALSDILPTAWQAVAYADVPEGGTLGVFGLGPLGQFTARIGMHLGYRVVAVDPLPERRALAEKYGVETFDYDTDIADTLREHTGGRGPDAVVDAVGMEAHGAPFSAAAQTAVGLLPDKLAKAAMETMGRDRLTALHGALDAVRRGGTVSVAGVYGGEADPLPVKSMFDKQVQLRMGQCSVRRWIDDLLPLVEQDDDPWGSWTSRLITFR